MQSYYVKHFISKTKRTSIESVLIQFNENNKLELCFCESGLKSEMWYIFVLVKSSRKEESKTIFLLPNPVCFIFLNNSTETHISYKRRIVISKNINKRMLFQRMWSSKSKKGTLMKNVTFFPSIENKKNSFRE